MKHVKITDSFRRSPHSPEDGPRQALVQRRRRWWGMCLLAVSLLLMPHLLPGQCPGGCRFGDVQSPQRLPIDSVGLVVLKRDSILQNPTVCPGNKRVTVRDAAGTLLAEGLLTAGVDSLVFRAANFVNTNLRVLITDVASGLFCEGYLRPVDLLPPLINCVADTIGCNADTSVAALGQPLVVDNSGRIRSLTYRDEWSPNPCGAAYAAVLDRTWTAVDNSGNTGQCFQRILIRRAAPDEYTFPRDTVLSCEDPLTDPGRTGSPTLNGRPIGNDGYCRLIAGFRDQILPQPNTADTRIVRTWSIIDQCTQLTVNGAQNIWVKDTVAPQIVCPADVVVNTLPNRCYANVRLPRPQIRDNCDPNPLLTVSTSFGGVGLGEHQFVGVGVHSVRYEVRDASGNISFCTIRLTVVDEEEPTAICHDVTIASVPAIGYARVYASSLDNGSYDNCRPKVFLKVRRMTPGACEGANGDDSPETGYQEWFDDYAVFCCEEVGLADIMVQLRVYEVDPGPGPVDPAREAVGGDLFGHYNECMVSVQVQDKSVPMISCPDNKTIECLDYFQDLPQAFGSPLVTEACGFTLDSTTTTTISNCGVGEILRKWTVTDTRGNTASCSQKVAIVNSQRITAEQIVWPKPYTTEQCGASLEPSALPAGFDKPVVNNELCTLVGINHKDQYFEVSAPGCYEILREWTVVDLCNYHPDQPGKGGRFTYTQRIRVNDRQAPELLAPRDTVVSIIQNCATARVNLLPATASDACVQSVTLQHDSPYADAPGANASGEYPMGETVVVFTATDKCGNITRARVKITVVDKKAPAPVCIVGLSASLSRMADGVMAMVDATAFDGGTTDPCGSAITRTIRRAGSGLTTSPTTTQLTFTCADLGPQAVEFWATDEQGNSSYCLTYINIQDNNRLCGNSGGNNPADISLGMIAGEILTEGGAEVEEVRVNVNAPADVHAMTGADGYYEIPDVPLGKDYTVVPEKNDDWLNGISTLDLVMLSKHILGVNRLGSPYRIIAGDVDGNGSVSTLDLIRLRKLVLGLQEEVPGNTSWRFIDAAHEFPRPDNPFLEPFPEVHSVNDFDSRALYADFVAVKVGDLNGSARPNRLAGVNPRATAGALTLRAAEQPFRAGEVVAVDVSGRGLEDVIGYQFTLDFDRSLLTFDDLETGDLPGLTRENFGLSAVDEGLLTTSWNELATRAGAGELRLFRLHFRALADGTLSQALRLNSRRTPAEAYDRSEQPLDVTLAFAAPEATPAPARGVGLKVHQNQPNPFRSHTVIAFDLAAASPVQLTVFDLSGKPVYQRERRFEPGYNEFEIYAVDLPASGVLYYQVEAGGERESRKMIHIS